MNRSPDINPTPKIENNKTAPHKPISVRRKLIAGTFATLSALGLVHHVDNNINGPLNTGAAADLVGSAIINDTSTIAEYVGKKSEDFAATVGDEISQVIAGPRADVYLNQQRELGKQLHVDLGHVDEILKGEVLVHKGASIRIIPAISYEDPQVGGKQVEVQAIGWKDIDKINGANWTDSSSLFIVKNPELTSNWMRLDLGIKGSPEKIVTGFIYTGPGTSQYVSAKGVRVGAEAIGTFNPSEIGKTIVPRETVNP